jgi:hypothetical protein
MAQNPTWVPVIDCFEEGKLNPFEIAKLKAGPEGDPGQLAERYYGNLTRLRNIREADYRVQVVPPSADIDEAIDVFDRVNSLGTKLAAADFALAHITGRWPQARQVMKAKIADLGQKRFEFDLTFMTRALTAVVKRRALFETIHKTPAEDLKLGWDRLSKILDYMVTLLPGHANIHSTEDLNTTNVLVPGVAYFSPQRRSVQRRPRHPALHSLALRREPLGPLQQSDRPAFGPRHLAHRPVRQPVVPTR